MLPSINMAYLEQILLDLLAIPSPTGWTHEAIDYLDTALRDLGIAPERTRRGALRARIKGGSEGLGRALAAHVDTLGAMIAGRKESGRFRLTPLGHWSARFAEGARVTVLGAGCAPRGTILPLKASVHAAGAAVDAQPVGWEHVELRLDAPPEVIEAIRVGDVVAVDPNPEILDTGYVVSRHLDDKAGVACVLAALEALMRAGGPAVDAAVLLTVTEEVGTGAGGLVPDWVEELICLDIAIVAPEHASDERRLSLVYKDAAGPFDLRLTRRLARLFDQHKLAWRRDVFRSYRSDAASALAAGHDVRVGLIGFGCDASHGYERAHLDGLREAARGALVYLLA